LAVKRARVVVGQEPAELGQVNIIGEVFVRLRLEKLPVFPPYIAEGCTVAKLGQCCDIDRRVDGNGRDTLKESSLAAPIVFKMTADA
jgi:hypothetical protein